MEQIKIPYIGKFSNLMEGVYVATGFKKWGMTTSHVAAKIITDEIIGKENPYAKVFSATRLEPIKNHKELGNMLKQTIYSLAINKVKKTWDCPCHGSRFDYMGKSMYSPSIKNLDTIEIIPII